MAIHLGKEKNNTNGYDRREMAPIKAEAERKKDGENLFLLSPQLPRIS